MGMDITILVGTMTGTAEMVAQEVQHALEGAGHQATIQVMDGLDASVFQGGGTFLICTSTYGPATCRTTRRRCSTVLKPRSPTSLG